MKEWRDPRFRELDIAIESAGEKFHRVCIGGVAAQREIRQHQLDRYSERRRKYLTETNRQKLLDSDGYNGYIGIQVSTKVQARVDDETLESLQAEAAKEDRTVSGVIARTLRKVFVTHEITLADRMKASVKKIAKGRK